MTDISIKQLSEYCRDYIDLVSPSVMSRGGKKLRLTADIFNPEPLLKRVPDFDYEEQIKLPINLSTKISELSIESESEDIETDTTIERNIAIARELDDIYRKFETNTYTRQLSLKFGHVSFKGKPNYIDEEEELEDMLYKNAEGYLFSVPILLSYKDSQGQRTYQITIDDSFVKTDIAFIKNYLKTEYKNELYKFVAIDATEENTSIPIDPNYVDELWTKIQQYLRFSDAVEISTLPDMADVVISLEPKANYFMSQDLAKIIEASDNEILASTSLSAWVDKQEEYVNTPTDDKGNNELFFPFVYDKYQLSVLSKINNKALIVEGPPGTGKSQTISNILVHLAAIGKKVLFVSQKDQAVRGVKDKLKELNIPNLFGYVPDRSSKLHTEQDEKDSATYMLRGISQTLYEEVESNPRNTLCEINTKVQEFETAISNVRSYTDKYMEWTSLDEYDFGENSKRINAEWYELIKGLLKESDSINQKIQELKNQTEEFVQNAEKERQSLNNLMKQKQELSEQFKINHDYIWLSNEERYVQSIGYKKLASLTKELIVLIAKNIPDRKKFILLEKINEFTLSNELNKLLSELPQELFETYKSISLSSTTKIQKQITLEVIEKYFSSMSTLVDQITTATFNISNLNNEKEKILNERKEKVGILSELKSKLNQNLLDPLSMERFENLYSKNGNLVYENIQRRMFLHSELETSINLDLNTVRQEIFKTKKQYVSQVRNYIKNRIVEHARIFGSKKEYRARLESIAKKLSKTKKAYKTFDTLKSEPHNFEAMCSVTPIWMMCLDDASRILPLQENLFDYVIIDEASQCNISYTLPVMYRSKHAIFFGDTLQMRDTTIAFKSNSLLSSIAQKHSIPEDLQIKAEGDSVKSVMDIAILNGIERVYLRNHYRSPIELIGFSNNNFYKPNKRGLEVINDDILATEDGRVLKTHLIQPNHAIEISSKSNLTEAYYIKQLINELRKSEKTRNKSIAVLSFFNEQAELLRRIISDESIKISTIEGIQGDEKDIVIFSLVISDPTLGAKQYRPLTGESGEIRKDVNAGRVNVAFSRARLQVHVVTSLNPIHWPEGVWIKKYLGYVEEHGRVNRLSKSELKFDSKFEESVYDYLTQTLDINKFRISTQAESCGFRIDQVITEIHTGKKLAIECDGPTHFDDGNGQVRVESDLERQLVLETAHWNFYRISYLDWQKESVKAKNDLMNYVNEFFTDSILKVETEIISNSEVEKVYEAIVVDVPVEIVSEHKEVINTPPNRGYFGRKLNKPTIAKSDEEISHATTLKNSEVIISTAKVDEQKHMNLNHNTQDFIPPIKNDNSKTIFKELSEISITSEQSIIMSVKGRDYWFNEKITSPSYTGFTQKGFGLNQDHLEGFKQALFELLKDVNSTERRFRINQSTELVVYRPSTSNIDMRQYVTTTKYTGFTKKGIRLTNAEAKKFYSELAQVL